MLIDTHCHLTSPDLTPQFDAVLARAADADVGRMITIATSPDDAVAAVQLMQRSPRICLSAGIHPHQAQSCNVDDLQRLRDCHAGTGLVPPELLPRLVAVGETGLDFHYDFAPRARQEFVFRQQLDLAVRVDRPVVIHARRAEGEVCDILAEYPALRNRVVFHCFSADLAMARRILDLGLWLSFTGVVTFKTADAVREAAKFVPLDRIMIETDAPYLAPVPYRGKQPCEPAFVALTARFLADLRGIPYDDFATATTANAKRFFRLPEEDA